MSENLLSRRAFLQFSGVAARNSLIVLSLPTILTACKEAALAQTENARFTALGSAEAAEFAAIAARIIPTDETPGATEAGVIYFIDNVLGSSRAEMLEPMRAGLAELQAAGSSMYGTKTFGTLSNAQQDELLASIEETQFFNTMRYLTIAGMFALPEYGGNRNLLGWKMIGFEDRHMWMPPFGFYDADYAAKGE
ncbi:MAG: gluconate 2-dehydrogenase subunit 3 family protein [Gammaproteobacteria bacterium]|nr:gluconate 2-dehydrogenase subunit 3 family protein [Gammaproteobacteria bacterium]MDP2139833.1 gluconate 2-dehydrogenase subunit 3 family protein [Gammaproteobacteria bacterium]MDP2347074.1 gluconate 2-dehydrogenase subunit 3 family protein [Gammaproteobacteria bacterium]